MFYYIFLLAERFLRFQPHGHAVSSEKCPKVVFSPIFYFQSVHFTYAEDYTANMTLITLFPAGLVFSSVPPTLMNKFIQLVVRICVFFIRLRSVGTEADWLASNVILKPRHCPELIQ